jgi:hypothetical protein
MHQHRVSAAQSRASRALLGLTVLTVALALSACAPATGSPSDAATSHVKSRPTPKATPVVTKIAVPAGASGDAFDRTLVSKYPYDSLRQTTVGAPVSVYFPGAGLISVNGTAYANGHDVVDQRVTIAGPDAAPVAVLALETRIPASGLDPETYRLELIAINPNGNLTKRFVVAKNAASSFTQPDGLVGSHSNIVALETLVPGSGDDSAVVVTGWNIATGQQLWHQPASIGAATFGSLALAYESGKNGDGNSCDDWKGLDIASGAPIWSVLSSTYKSATSGSCNVSRAISYSGSAQHSSLTVLMSDDSSGFAPNRYIGFTSSGKPLNLAAGDDRHGNEIYDPVTGYGSVADQHGGITVTDPTTGKTIFAISDDRAGALDIRVLGFYSGLLFTKTTDGQPVVDVATGKVVMDTPTVYPESQVGKWTLYNDGVLRIQANLLVK